MQFNKKLAFGLMAACGLSLLPMAFAQTITTGDVVGTVKDTTGAVVPGSTVILRSTDFGDTRSVATDNSGAFRFTFLKPGNYTAAASSAGLKTDVQKLAVEVGQVATLELIAKVQATQEVIEVLASGAIVETENANLSTTYNTTQMEELPTPGGDMTTIAFTAPGVVVSTGMGYGNFSSHGLPGVSNLFTINGNDYNDAYLNLNNSGASNLMLGTNEVQEAAVVQNAYSVQYGREAGAQVNYITKSGTNGFHGDLNYNWNGDRLNANDFFANTDGLARSKAISNQWAADVGGPIRKDKTFFYADTEGLYYTLPSSGVVTVPTPQLQTYILNTVSAAALPLYQNAFKIWNGAPGISGAVPITNGSGRLQDANNTLGCGVQGFGNGTIAAPGGGFFGTTVPCGEAWATTGSNTNKEHLYTFRVDHSLTDKQKIYVRLKHDDGFQPTATSLINTTFNEQSIQPEWDGAINYTYVITPTVVNSFIGSALWYSAYFGPANVAASQKLFPTAFFFNDGGANGGGFYQMGSSWNSFPQGRDVGQAQLTDDLSITRGRHTIKVGENFRRNRVSDFGLLSGTTGYSTFDSLADFANGNFDAGVGSNYQQKFTSITTAHIRLYNIGVYAQDEWAAAKNLKLTLGIRFDRTGNPECVDNCFSRLSAPFTSSSFQAGVNIPYNQSIDTGLGKAYYSVDSVVPQPRLGVVWSPMGGSNSMVIRAGFGLFADLSPAFLVSGLYNNSPYPFGAFVNNSAFEVGLASDPNSAAAAAQNQFNAFKTGFFNGETLAQLNAAVPGGFGPFGYFSIPQHTGTPEYAEWSFEIEQPIGQKNVVVATYTGNHGYNLLVQNGFANATAANFTGLPSAPPDPRFLGVNQIENQGISNYDGLTIQYRRAFSHGFQGQISYTWSHSLDDISNGGSGLPYTFTANIVTSLINPNVKANYGNSDYDIRHSVVGDFVWDTPWKFNSRGLNYVLGNWSLSSKLYLRTGVPESITDNNLPGDIGGGTILDPILATAVTGLPHSCGTAAVNGATPCMSQADFLPSGTEPGFGNIGRNSLFGPGYFNIDTTLYKNIAITERVRFTIGASAYNLLNHPHFADPVANSASGAVGSIYGTVSPPTSAYGAFQGSLVSGREVVLTAKFRF
jgi:outer membrane receptor protein involved in Fe transport